MGLQNSTLIGLQLTIREAYGLFAVNGILFNHESQGGVERL